MGAGKYGGFGNTAGKNKVPQLPNTDGNNKGKGKVSLPKGDSQIKHIFGKREGHLPDTPYHRKQLKDLANNQGYYKGVDKRGNTWHIKIMKDGSQLWVQHRNGIIQNGGKNLKPIKWDKETGLSRNPMKKKKGGKKS